MSREARIRVLKQMGLVLFFTNDKPTGCNFEYDKKSELGKLISSITKKEWDSIK